MPVFTVTVLVAPLPVTDVIDAPITPVVARVKLLPLTPVTASENVTVKATLVAFVGVAPTRAMLDAAGGTLSITRIVFAVVPQLPTASRPRT